MSNMYEQFKAFAASKPADEEYNVFDSRNCAVAQFAKSIDADFSDAGITHWVSRSPTFPKGFKNIHIIDSYADVYRYIRLYRAVSNSLTFGELASKL